ncbi:TraB/GumN family protein [Candidatus Woesearchaeota archaeon]|nr:TraB/GumN family protein [Candidatus Woesearchaeota archaeon]MBW2994290.1 TraB/GumN family protein [Candidatus Woesearchaeota archaeon]
MKFKNLTIIGTSHIAKQSIKEVREAILKEEPDIVALELDKKRLAALLSEKKGKVSVKDIKHVGLKGWIFSIIGAWVEKKLGDQVGVSPGSDMVAAFKAARKAKAKVALIDQDIEITLKHFSKELSWREKWNFFVDIIKGLIFRKTEIGFDLSTVPTQATISKLIKKVKKRYPNIYKVLIVERNKVMASNLTSLLIQFPDDKIVAIVGAGHEKDILDIVKRKLKE